MTHGNTDPESSTSALEKEKLRLEIHDLRRPLYLHPTFWIGLFTAAVAVFGVIHERTLSNIRKEKAELDVLEAGRDLAEAQELRQATENEINTLAAQKIVEEARVRQAQLELNRLELRLEALRTAIPPSAQPLVDSIAESIGAVRRVTESLRIQILDRGQGDGILIRTPNEHWVVIDAGADGQQADSMRDVWGVDRLALAIVSHRHRDHFGGMDEVLESFPVERFLGVMDECPTRRTDDRLREINAERNISVLTAGADTIVIDGVRFIVLPQAPCAADENNNSVVVRVEFGNFSMLFPGDAEQAQRDWLVANYPELLDVNALKASHHGSRQGTSESWLSAVTAEMVVISAGAHRGFRHPHPEAVESYIAATGNSSWIYCTNRHGTVSIYAYYDGRVLVRRERPSEKSCVYDGTR